MFDAIDSLSEIINEYDLFDEENSLIVYAILFFKKLQLDANTQCDFDPFLVSNNLIEYFQKPYDDTLTEEVPNIDYEMKCYVENNNLHGGIYNPHVNYRELEAYTERYEHISDMLEIAYEVLETTFNHYESIYEQIGQILENITVEDIYESCFIGIDTNKSTLNPSYLYLIQDISIKNNSQELSLIDAGFSNLHSIATSFRTLQTCDHHAFSRNLSMFKAYLSNVRNHHLLTNLTSCHNLVVDCRIYEIDENVILKYIDQLSNKGLCQLILNNNQLSFVENLYKAGQCGLQVVVALPGMNGIEDPFKHVLITKTSIIEPLYIDAQPMIDPLDYVDYVSLFNNIESRLCLFFKKPNIKSMS